MYKYKTMTFNNGDIYDIGQTVNGVNKFIIIENVWHYYDPNLMRKYEYSQNELFELIHDDQINEFGETKLIANIFSSL